MGWHGLAGGLLGLDPTLVDRSGDVGAALVVALLVLLGAHSLLFASGHRGARLLVPVIAPLAVLAAAVFAVRLVWLAS